MILFYLVVIVEKMAQVLLLTISIFLDNFLRFFYVGQQKAFLLYLCKRATVIFIQKEGLIMFALRMFIKTDK